MAVQCSAVLIAALLCAGTLEAPARARVYGDLFRFNDGVAAGGGGGRWFTGSPADGYGCAVCHIGPAAQGVVVQGLPERYQPGVTYDIYIAWPTTERIAGLVELTDAQGHGAGTVGITDGPAPAAESC
jgi:hypothetical protein